MHSLTAEIESRSSHANKPRELKYVNQPDVAKKKRTVNRFKSLSSWHNKSGIKGANVELEPE